jgi:hypothetical protein
MLGAIMFALAVGVGSILTATVSGTPAPLPLIPLALSLSARACQLSGLSVRFVTLAAGVGQMGDDPDAVAPVRGADGGSGHTVPDRIIPERGQAPENRSHSPTKQSWDVLHDDDAGS